MITAAIALALFACDGLFGQGRTFDLLTASVADIQAAVGSWVLTYEQLVRLYLNRIQAYDRSGPRLNAILYVNPRAVEIARALDEERRTKGLRGPLHGIPVAIKDNIDVRDLPSAGGSSAFAGSYPARDAFVIERLREAGAILFLKTNMDELAVDSRGLSSLGGQILNPYDLTRNPGGSSGGTAVCINAGFAAVGLATETGFSVRGPATNNAIVGVAPSRGLVSRSGVMPISFTQDRVGVHAKSVADAALLLGVMRGFDTEDLSTAEGLGSWARTPYSNALHSRLNGKRIGVLRDLFRKGTEFEEGNRLVERQISVLAAAGATIVDGLSTGLDLAALMGSLRVNVYELRSAFDTYIRRRGPASPVKNLADLLASGKFLKGGSLDVRYRETLKYGLLDQEAAYLSTLEMQRTVKRLLVEAMDRASVEALIYPVKALGAPPIGSSDSGPRDNNISAVTGLPAIVLPAGFNQEGLPIAMELLGRPFSEPSLISVAHLAERAAPARISPKTTPHMDGEVFSIPRIAESPR